jgi:hydroxymethylpyrimidine/phosphomethylpyrimidine kinase
MTVPTALSIAGSDPSGGAGIQADLKTFSALGVYGMAVLTALTAQNTRGVHGLHRVPPAFVAAQITALRDDLPLGAVKIGMIATAAIAAAVAQALDGLAAPLVLDPVMVAKGGHRLLKPDAAAALRDLLLPRATVVTPNLPEAAALLGRPEAANRAEMGVQALALRALGARAVLLKGGHLPGDVAPDLLLTADTALWLEGPRTPTRNTHGTGCTLSAALAAELAKGAALPEAARRAKAYTAAAIAAADRLGLTEGDGHGPTHHFHALWPALRPAPRPDQT